MKPVNKSFLAFLFIIALAITGSGLVLHATRGGIGAQSDSAFYVGVARSLAEGTGTGLDPPHHRVRVLQHLSPTLLPLPGRTGSHRAGPDRGCTLDECAAVWADDRAGWGILPLEMESPTCRLPGVCLDHLFALADRCACLAFIGTAVLFPGDRFIAVTG